MISNSKMMKWDGVGRRLATFLLIHTPLLSFGELVLRPVTIAERYAGDIPAPAAGHNKT
jgi:hypothetical protein